MKIVSGQKVYDTDKCSLIYDGPIRKNWDETFTWHVKTTFWLATNGTVIEVWQEAEKKYWLFGPFKFRPFNEKNTEVYSSPTMAAERIASVARIPLYEAYQLIGLDLEEVK